MYHASAFGGPGVDLATPTVKGDASDFGGYEAVRRKIEVASGLERTAGAKRTLISFTVRKLGSGEPRD